MRTEREIILGLSWIEDCASRGCFTNLIAMCINKLPAVKANLDFTSYMVDFGKKDDEFIMTFSNPTLMSLIQ